MPQAQAYDYKWTRITSPGTVPTAYVPSSLPIGGNAIVGVGQQPVSCEDYPDYAILTSSGEVKYVLWSTEDCTASSWQSIDGTQTFSGVVIGAGGAELPLPFVWNGSSLYDAYGFGPLTEIGTGASGQGWNSPTFLLSTYDNEDLLAIGAGSCGTSGGSKPWGSCVYKYTGDYTSSTGWEDWYDTGSGWLGVAQLTQDGSFEDGDDTGSSANLDALDGDGNLWFFNSTSGWTNATAVECGTETTFQAAQIAQFGSLMLGLHYNGGSGSDGVWEYEYLSGCWSGPIASNPSGSGGLFSLAAPAVFDAGVSGGSLPAHIHYAYATDGNGDLYLLDYCSGGC